MNEGSEGEPQTDVAQRNVHPSKAIEKTLHLNQDGGGGGKRRLGRRNAQFKLRPSSKTCARACHLSKGAEEQIEFR